jgi:hypothetical protein
MACGRQHPVGLAGSAGTGGSNAAGTGGINPAGSGGSNAAGTGGSNAAGTGGSNAAGTGGSNAAGSGGTTCAPPIDPDAPIEQLSMTGCRDPARFRDFAPRAVPYVVNSPASDVRYGRRAFVLPEGGKIHVKACTATPSDCPHGAADDGKWVFPVGTVVMQDVSGLGVATALETRFLARVADGSWVGYSYQWNQAQTEATLTPSDERIATTLQTGEGAISEVIPARQDCLACHNAEAGGALGIETAQLNLKDSNGGEQLDRIAALGVFEVALPRPYKEALSGPNTDSLAEPTTLDHRTRSYMHTNCSFCHRPGGVYPRFDLRFATPFAERAICNAPAQVQFGTPYTPVILAPGSPRTSSLVNAGEAWTHVICASPNGCVFYSGPGYGRSLLDLWVTSITSCP